MDRTDLYALQDIQPSPEGISDCSPLQSLCLLIRFFVWHFQKDLHFPVMNEQLDWSFLICSLGKSPWLHWAERLQAMAYHVGRRYFHGEAYHSWSIYVCFLSDKMTTSFPRIPPNMIIVWRDRVLFCFVFLLQLSDTTLKFKTLKFTLKN